MLIKSVPGSPVRYGVSSDTTIKPRDILGTEYTHWVISTAGTMLTMPTPIKDLTGYFIAAQNRTTNGALIKGTFTNADTGLFLAPRETVLLVCLPTAAGTFEWNIVGNRQMVDKGTWTPTPVFSTATPTTTKDFQYWVVKQGNAATCFIRGKLSTTDGAGGTLTSVPLATTVPAPYTGCRFPVVARQTIDGTTTELIGWIECNDATAANRVITFPGASAWTDDKACSVEFTAYYELYGWSSYTATEAWTTGTPASITKTSRFTVLGDVCLVAHTTSSADSNACTALTVTLPIVPLDLDTYIQFNAVQLAGSGGATYYKPRAFVDSANATEETRALIQFSSFTTATDGQNVAVYACGHYFIGVGPTTQTWTPALVWTKDGTIASDPEGSVVTKAHFSIQSGICFGALYYSATDGNACTNVYFTSPSDLSGISVDFPVSGYQLQNTSHSNPLAYLDVSDKKVRVGGFTTAANAQAVKLRIAPWYPVV